MGLSNNPAGRPRSVAATQRLHETFWRLLGSVPYELITMERIAAEARVSRTALYRRFGSLKELTLAALLRVGEQQLTMHSTADVLQDLHAYLKSVVLSLDRRGNVGKAFRIVLATVQTDDSMTVPFREFLTQRREPVRSRLMALKSDLPEVELDLLLDQLFGPILYRLLIRNLEVGDVAIQIFIQSVAEKITWSKRSPN